VAWVALTFRPPYQPIPRTRANLSSDGRALASFLGKYKKSPDDMGELRAFAAAEHMRFRAYDTYGQRLDYLKLDAEHYILRSFAGDGVQNTMNGQPDMGIAHWGARPPRNPVYRYTTDGAPGLYPAALLMGADSPDHSWYARLFVDASNGTRLLLARQKGKAARFMTAPHDAVEEFLWLPDGKRIVYTATGSVRHRDGLYLWNLANDSLVNLTDLARSSLPMSPAARDEGLNLALAGVGAKGPTVSVYAASRGNGPLDPRVFFSREHLVNLTVPEGHTPKPLAQPRGPEASVPPLAQPFLLAARLDGAGGLNAQKAWLALPLDGTLEDVLLAWQHFSEREDHSPLLPYCLWVLSSLYGQGSALLAPLGSRDADVLRTYGAEIARGLLNYPLAPSYLKGLALFAQGALMDGAPLPYHFAQLTAGELDTEAVAVPPFVPTPKDAQPAPAIWKQPAAPKDGEKRPEPAKKHAATTKQPIAPARSTVVKKPAKEPRSTTMKRPTDKRHPHAVKQTTTVKKPAAVPKLGTERKSPVPAKTKAVTKTVTKKPAVSGAKPN